MLFLYRDRLKRSLCNLELVIGDNLVNLFLEYLLNLCPNIYCDAARDGRVALRCSRVLCRVSNAQCPVCPRARVTRHLYA